ncbi:MAG: metal-dependent hydrolase [Lamprobacter sp.]|uniref:metal-dependent hydrolase n=1 Tax=Lamprobacter sp. TaxID=3100796 RepID=UPI002B263829|nr:metal-dependent hydrolase [Lamprobacter sp.]MEA3640247.1 metal-dependent hydrolase [Lamprobacter sp.]
MLTPTHLVAAQSTYLIACVVTGNPPYPAQAAVALLGALIPDIDSRQSYVGRLVPPLSTWIGNRFGHRTLTHSLVAQVTVFVVAWFLLPAGFFIALVAGWVSHVFGDMMTKSGVCWFWPSLSRCVLPGNPSYRMEVSGRGELWFLVTLAAVGLVMMPLAQRAEGTTGLIRSAIGDAATARQDFDADKGRLAFDLKLRGRDNTTYADISGTYPVIGPWKDSGFLIATDAGPRSTCRSTACDWYADHADLSRGAEQQTTSFPLTVATATAETLKAAIKPIVAEEIYLLGSFTAPESKAVPPTVMVSGDQVTLFYAEPELLEAWQGRVLADVNLTVQARHDPDVDPGRAGLIGVSSARIDARLQRWLQ